MSGIDASIVQISTASAQLEITAYKRLAMEMVVEQAKPERIKYNKPNVGEQTFPGLREFSAKAIKKLTEMGSLRESLADELSRKMATMKRQDDVLSGKDATARQPCVKLHVTAAAQNINANISHCILSRA